MTNSTDITTALAVLGFAVNAAGVLHASAGATIALIPTNGRYFRLVIDLPGGAAVSCIVPVVALKICCEGAEP